MSGKGSTLKLTSGREQREFLEANLHFFDLEKMMVRDLFCIFKYGDNLVPEFSPTPGSETCPGLVTCIPESGRSQTNDLREGMIRVKLSPLNTQV